MGTATGTTLRAGIVGTTDPIVAILDITGTRHGPRSVLLGWMVSSFSIFIKLVFALHH